MHIKELFSLKGKVILVTGGSGNYGKCIVEGMAEADGTIITASRNLEKNEETAFQFRSKGLDVHAMQLDQGDHESILSIKEEIKNKFGKLDVLVNNSVIRPMEGYDSPIEQFAESMRVNATGMVDLTREMTQLMIENGQGSIINIGSMMGMFGPDLSNYEGTTMSMTPPPDYFYHNSGLLNFTRYWARMMAGKNIRVNTVSPGGLFNHQSERFIANYSKKVPLGRLANHDDIKGIVVLLASDAGAYINGENILMDGGMHA